MKPALLHRAAVRTEDGLERELCGTRQRMLVDPYRIIHAVEFDRLSHRSFHHLRVALHLHGDPPDPVQAIEYPRGLLWCGLGAIQDRNGRRDEYEDQDVF